MMDACYCDDGERPDVYDAEVRKARKSYACYECTTGIKPGERYERVATLYEGRWETTRTCCRCLDLRQYVEAHAPCFCWLHGSMLDDARDVIEQYSTESAGFLIGASKRYMRAAGQRPWATERSPLRMLARRGRKEG